MPDAHPRHGKRRRTGSVSEYTSLSPATGLGLDALGLPILRTTESTGYESTESIGSASTYRDAGTQTGRDDHAPSGLTAAGSSTLYLQGSFGEVSRTYIKSIYLGSTRDEQDHWIWHKMEMLHALDSLKRSRDSIDKLPDPKFVLPREPPALPKITLPEEAPQAVGDLVCSWQEFRAAVAVFFNCVSRKPQMRQACAGIQDPGFLRAMRHQATSWKDSLSYEFELNASKLASKCLSGLVLLSPATKEIYAKPRNLPNNPVGHFGDPPAGGVSDPGI